MKPISFDQCDSPDEIAKLFDRVFADLELTNNKVSDLEKKMSASDKEEIVDKPKKNKKGFSSIGILSILVVLALAAGAFAAEAWPITYDNVSNPQSLYDLLSNRLTDVSLADGKKLYLGSPIGVGDMYLSVSNNILTIGQVVAGTGSVRLGANDAGVDFTLFGDTASKKAWWDASADTWYYGADKEGVDVLFYADTTGDYIMWDESDEAFEAVGAQIHLDDDSDLQFGTDKDWSIDSDTTKVLDILPLAGDETYTINIGADTAGADLKLFGATTGESLLWDSSGDDLIGTFDSTLFTMTSAAANAFKVDATGTVAGNAIVFETTNGGIQLLADGSANGDITIDAEDDVAITTAGDLALTITGSVTGNIKRTSQQYIQSIAYAKLGDSGAGWVIGAADNVSLATLPASQTSENIVIPITIPLKVGWTITAFTINGQIDSAGNAATLDADLRKHTEATDGYADASVGAMTQLSKTADYKVVDGKTALTEVVAADESFYLLVTGTTGETTDIEIASITITVSEI